MANYFGINCTKTEIEMDAGNREEIRYFVTNNTNKTQSICARYKTVSGKEISHKILGADSVKLEPGQSTNISLYIFPGYFTETSTAELQLTVFDEYSPDEIFTDSPVSKVSIKSQDKHSSEWLKNAGIILTAITSIICLSLITFFSISTYSKHTTKRFDDNLIKSIYDKDDESPIYYRTINYWRSLEDKVKYFQTVYNYNREKSLIYSEHELLYQMINETCNRFVDIISPEILIDIFSRIINHHEKPAFKYGDIVDIINDVFYSELYLVELENIKSTESLNQYSNKFAIDSNSTKTKFMSKYNNNSYWEGSFAEIVGLDTIASTSQIIQNIVNVDEETGAEEILEAINVEDFNEVKGFLEGTNKLTDIEQNNLVKKEYIVKKIVISDKLTPDPNIMRNNLINYIKKLDYYYVPKEISSKNNLLYEKIGENLSQIINLDYKNTRLIRGDVLSIIEENLILIKEIYNEYANHHTSSIIRDGDEFKVDEVIDNLVTIFPVYSNELQKYKFSSFNNHLVVLNQLINLLGEIRLELGNFKSNNIDFTELVVDIIKNKRLSTNSLNKLLLIRLLLLDQEVLDKDIGFENSLNLLKKKVDFYTFDNSTSILNNLKQLIISHELKEDKINKTMDKMFSDLSDQVKYNSIVNNVNEKEITISESSIENGDIIDVELKNFTVSLSEDEIIWSSYIETKGNGPLTIIPNIRYSENTKIRIELNHEDFLQISDIKVYVAEVGVKAK